MIAIVGAGVSGLTSGITLQESGFNTTIVAHKFSPDTTSDISAALWYPYKSEPRERVLRWGDASFKAFEKLTHFSETGVSFVEVMEVLPGPGVDPWWKESVRNFRTANPAELPLEYSHGYLFEAPLIEMPVYMNYLKDRYLKSGGRIKKLSAKLTSFDEISEHYHTIINCSGMGARKLADDTFLYPISGQIVITTNPGIKRCVIDLKGKRSLTYIIPRKKDCILGGTGDEGDWNTMASAEAGERILKSCCAFEPRLENAKILSRKIGLRPARKGGIRLEAKTLDSCKKIIHNYGHGGAGVTVSWGCAREVLELVKKG